MAYIYFFLPVRTLSIMKANIYKQALDRVSLADSTTELQLLTPHYRNCSYLKSRKPKYVTDSCTNDASILTFSTIHSSSTIIHYVGSQVHVHLHPCSFSSRSDRRTEQT
jgi:hypothetical protein